MSFENKVVILTGGGTGIGAAIALLFAKEGAQLVLAARRQAKLDKTAEKCAAIGKKPLTISADVSNQQDLQKIIDVAISKFQRIDVLIKNAAILKPGTKIQDKNIIADFDEIVNTNLRSVVILTHLAAPYLAKTKGNIVNISSISAIRTRIGGSAYAVSKAGMNHFTRAAAQELAEVGVRVNSVSPGATKTEILTESENLNWDMLKNKTALNKLIKPEEVAELVAFVASSKGECITGSDYVIDCGNLIKW